MIGANEIVHGLTGAWRIALRDPEARKHFDLSAQGLFHSFAALLLTLPILFFTTTALWKIGQESQMLDIADFTTFVSVEIGGAVLHWLFFLLAMIAVARHLGLTASFTPYVIVFNWGTLTGWGLFALPLVLHMAGIIAGPAAVTLTLPVFALFAWYRWQIAREVLGAPPSAALAILVLDVTISLLTDQGLARLVFTPTGGT